jgi:hypothetical protein
VIVAYAGRRPQATSKESPVGTHTDVGDRIEQLLANLSPRLVVGAAAAGADILVLEAARRLNIAARILLPTSVEEFKRESVLDKGPEWGQRFDTVVDRAQVEILDGAEIGDKRFIRANNEILNRAAAAVQDHESVLVLGIIDQARRPGDITAHFLGEATRRGLLTLQLDPSRHSDDLPIGFVAMPYGARMDPLNILGAYDCDATYHRILVPLLMDAGYRPVRADTEVSGIIDLEMLRLIASAQLFVADLATHNPNVFWELGVRHAWRPYRSILVSPDHVPIPFDVNHITVHRYRRSPDRVSDLEAIGAMEELQSVFRQAPTATGVDSPAFAMFPSLVPTVLGGAEAGSANSSETYQRLMERISRAVDLRQIDALAAVARETRRATLPQGALGTLLEQAGVGMISLGQHDQALELLRPAAEADTAFHRVSLQQRYAHALLRRQPGAEYETGVHDAELRLKRLNSLQPGSAETLGLLGSAAKIAFGLALPHGASIDAHLARAIDAYLDGFRENPGEYYPGINAVALLRIRGQYFDGDEEDLREARALIPVVRFAILRVRDIDPWARATLAELELHEQMLDAAGSTRKTPPLFKAYAAACEAGTEWHRRSMASQLQLLRRAGDPPELIDPLLELVNGYSIPN